MRDDGDLGVTFRERTVWERIAPSLRKLWGIPREDSMLMTRGFQSSPEEHLKKVVGETARGYKRVLEVNPAPFFLRVDRAEARYVEALAAELCGVGLKIAEKRFLSERWFVLTLAQ